MKPITVQASTSRIPKEDETSKLGQWFWVKDPEDTEDKPWLGCVVQEGSNYVEVESPLGSSTRVHVENFHERLQFELDPEAVIKGRVAYHNHKAAELMGEADALVKSLGLKPTTLLGRTGLETSTALTVPQGKSAIKKYEGALIKAHKETLPKLFKAVNREYELSARWLQASTLPLLAQLTLSKEVVGKIKNRIYAIELYAGLVEEVEECCTGKAAPETEKIRLMQRRLYMDEECLLDYKAGGMEFKNLHSFENWLCKPRNRDRILPFPKCVVSMQVRRHAKDREVVNFLAAFINIQLEQADAQTFLYIRNGEKVYRLSTNTDFGEKLFPDKASFDPGRPMMAKMFARRVDKLVDKAEYDALKAEDQVRRHNLKQWERDYPEETWNEKKEGPWGWANPFREDYRFREYEWQPFTPESVYYDDIGDVVSERIVQYNRVALIVQGLLDRSPVFQPTPKVNTWSGEAFLNAIELVYDASNILAAGEKPDFEAYRSVKNATLETGSITIGQEDFWLKREAARYNEQAARSIYASKIVPVHRYRPEGDPGPGFTATISTYKAKRGVAVFRWKRNRRRAYWESGEIAARVDVPASKLFNVSAYTPGEFKQFFRDPRTRAEYLQWAPFLLGAEDWWAKQKKSHA